MAEDDTSHSYQVNQDNKEYIITTQLLNDGLRVECQDNNIPEQPIYARIFTLHDFKEMDFYFQPYNLASQIQDELDKTIEAQTVSIYNNNDNTINISFLLKNDLNTAIFLCNCQENIFNYNYKKFKKQKRNLIIMNFKEDAVVL